MDQPRSWYKKKRFLIPIGLAAVLAVVALANNNPQTTVQSAQQNAVVQQQTIPATNTAGAAVPAQTAPPKAQQQTTNTTPQTPAPTLSNNSYYQNVNGNNVHSPAYTSDNSVPAGASALCGDGTYSFSQHRQGTCSHHGGVVVWY